MAELENFEYKYPIYTGPHFLCTDCRTMFISEEFMNKHQKKCIHRKLHLFLKLKFQLRRNTPADNTIIRTKIETTEDYFCEECFSGFLTLSDFESHIQAGHSEEVLFTSHLSDQKYSVENKSEPLIDMTPQREKASKGTFHNRYNAAKPSLNCPNDQEKLKSKRLGNHSNKHTGQKPFICDHCKKGFSRKAHLESHLLIHTGEKPFVCDQCEKGFLRKNHLKIHLLVHTGQKSFVCDHCDKRFSRLDSLNRHLPVHSIEKPFVCDHCDKSFTQKNSLKTHIFIHTGEMPFVCEHCHKGFSRINSLNRHLLIHSGEKPFACDHCDKRFTEKSKLNKHMKSLIAMTAQKEKASKVTLHNRYNASKRKQSLNCPNDQVKLKPKRLRNNSNNNHTGQKPYFCVHCDKHFSQNSKLKRHLLIHTGEKPFVCDNCDKGFSQKSHLEGHLLVHTGERPFACNHCNKRFTDKSNLNKHLKIHSQKID